MVELRDSINVLKDTNPDILEDIEKGISYMLTDAEGEEFAHIESIDAAVDCGNARCDISSNKKNTDTEIKLYERETFLKTSTPGDSPLGKTAYSDEIYRSFINAAASNFKLSEDPENLIRETKKELELLEIKKLRRDKLVREHDRLEKKLNKLIKEKSELEQEIEVLNKIKLIKAEIEKIESEKKDITEELHEIQEIHDSIGYLEERIHNLSMISGKRLKNSDLDNIQNIFSSMRDFSARVENRNTEQSSLLKKMIKRSSAVIIFILTIFMFFLSRNSFNFRETAESLSVLIYAGALMVIADAVISITRYHRNKKFLKLTHDEIERKKIELNEILELNIEDAERINYEIYEYLGQYFEEYTEAEELGHEKRTLKNRIKVRRNEETLKENMSLLNREIKQKQKDLEILVHGLGKNLKEKIGLDPINIIISDTSDEINTLINSIDETEGICSEARKEAQEYDRLDREGPYFDQRIEYLQKKIDTALEQNDIIKILSPVIDKSLAEWKDRFAGNCSENIAELFNELTENSFSETVNGSTVDNYLRNSEEIPGFDEKGHRLLLILIQYAISTSNTFRLPPYIVNLDRNLDLIKNIHSFRRIMLELSAHRQVIIFSTSDLPDTESCELNING